VINSVQPEIALLTDEILARGIECSAVILGGDFNDLSFLPW
jgi:hypothetical protein